MRLPMLLIACAAPLLLAAPLPAAASEEGAAAPDPPRWSLVIHGGAGVISKEMDEETKDGYRQALEGALKAGREVLAGGGTALDAVERVVLLLEEDPRFNAGRGAVYTHEGTHELDAAIMDGATLEAGAVAAVRTVRNPIRLARLVMERSPHVLLAGDGAEALADRFGLERVDNSFFDTDRRHRQLQEAIEREQRTGEWHERFGTVGAVARDARGDLAAATSTGGLTNKRFGRIGDTPIVGAGTYAANATCAVSGTGRGEEFIRHAVGRTVAALMEYAGLSLQEAADRVVHQILKPGEGGVIAVDGEGNAVWSFNTTGMFRGAATSDGRFEVAIWEE